MKTIIALLIAASFFTGAVAQVFNPVHWAYGTKKIDAQTYELHIAATIDDDWHIYSGGTPAGGPVPTTIKFTANPAFTLVGKIKEIGDMEHKHEAAFGIDVWYYEKKADFVQVIRLKSSIKTVKGSIHYMTCNDHQCLPPETIPFTITIK